MYGVPQELVKQVWLCTSQRTTFDYIRMITASELLALPDAHKIDKIHHAFTESYKYVVISKMLILTQ